jgi:hypothetical protein
VDVDDELAAVLVDAALVVEAEAEDSATGGEAIG